MNTRTLLAALALGCSVCGAQTGASADTDVRYFVGLGAGYEAGSGLHLGLRQGGNAGQLGVGLLYDDQAAEITYSLGLRYLRTLYAGRVNDTYAWAGTGFFGSRRAGHSRSTVSPGAGVGISLHFGLPFHLNLDSGLHAMFDPSDPGGRYEFGATGNVSLVYEW